MTARSDAGALPAPAQQLFTLRNDHRFFLENAVWTLDQADKIAPLKRYPSQQDKPYLYELADRIVKTTLLALVKHRRMLATWTCCALAAHEALFFEGRNIAIISKKEEDSDELVRRVKFIIENITKDIMPVKPSISYKYTELRIHDINSTVKGFAQGPDQLRQHTMSRIYADEIGFWPNARATFVAMKPTLQGGGKICLLSTRYPGFFKELIEDTIDGD